MAFDPVRPGNQAVANSIQQLIDAWQGVAGRGQPMSLTSLRSASYALTLRNLDTANGGRHIRVLNSANPADVIFSVTDTGAQMARLDVTDAFGFPGGSAAAPGFYVTGDINTGFYSAAANQIGIATDGVSRLLVDNTGVAVAGLLSATNGLTISGGALSLPAGAVVSAALENGAATGVKLGSDVATLTGAQTLTNKTLTLPQINDTSADHQYVVAVSELAADRTVSLPLLTTNDTFVFADFAQTLTNKILASPTINSPSITTLTVTSGGVAITGDSTFADRIRLAGAAAYDGIDTTTIGSPAGDVKLKVAGSIRMTAGGLVFPDGSTQTTAPSATPSSLQSAGDITIGSDTDSSGAGDILLQTRGSTKIKIPSLATAGGVLEMVQAATPAAPSALSSRLYIGTDGQVYTIDNGGNAGLIAALGYDDPITNGDFRIWQRGTSFSPITSGSYAADRWIYSNTSTAEHAISRSTDVPAVSGINLLQNYSMLVDCSTADASIAAGDVCGVQQRIEGYNFASIAQRPFTLSFWVKATKTGTYCVSFVNVGADRSYVAEYTINSTATWEYKTVTVPASPTAGTWNYTSGIGAYLTFTLAAGSTYQTTTGAWQTGGFYGTSNQVNALDSISNDFQLSMARITPGGIAAPFSQRRFDLELTLCQRYFERLSGSGASYGTWLGTAVSSTDIRFIVPYSTQKRGSDPSITFSANSDIAALNQGASNAGTGILSLLNAGDRVAACRLDSLGTITVTAGDCVMLRWASTSAYIDVNKEI